ncbi:MAG: P-type ATPase [Thermodesulfobacteriota bacterium]
MKGDTAAAVREGKIVTIAADELRRGDLVLVQTGDIVPADLTLLETSDLEVDEFELTGELMPVPNVSNRRWRFGYFKGARYFGGTGKGL